MLPKRNRLISGWVEKDYIYEYFQTIAYQISVYIAAVKLEGDKTVPFTDNFDGKDEDSVIRVFFRKEDAHAYADVLLSKGYDLAKLTMLEFGPLELYKVMMRLNRESSNKKIQAKACLFLNEKMVSIDTFYKNYKETDKLFQ